MEKESKNFRTLDMYVCLCEGKTVNKAEESRRFGVDECSIQRDIDDIRAFLDERSASSGDGRTIEYDRTKKFFIMVGAEPWMRSLKFLTITALKRVNSERESNLCTLVN